jgi:hypothetical protein
MMMMSLPVSSKPVPVSFWQQWFSSIEQTLLAPQAFFQSVVAFHCSADDWDTPYVRQGLGCVVLVAVLLALQPVVVGKIPLNAFDVLMDVLGALIFWAVHALLIGTVGYVFRGHAKANSLLALLGFASLPWVFLVPLAILKTQFMAVGAGLLFPFGALGLWGWSTYLFLKVISVSYGLNTERVMVLCLLPIVAVLLLVLGTTVFWTDLTKVFFA